MSGIISRNMEYLTEDSKDSEEENTILIEESYNNISSEENKVRESKENDKENIEKKRRK